MQAIDDLELEPLPRAAAVAGLTLAAAAVVALLVLALSAWQIRAFAIPTF